MNSPLPYQRCPRCRAGQTIGNLVALANGRRHRWDCPGCGARLRLSFRIGDVVFWPAFAALIAWEWFDWPFDPSRGLLISLLLVPLVVSAVLAYVVVVEPPPPPQVLLGDHDSGKG